MLNIRNVHTTLARLTVACIIRSQSALPHWFPRKTNRPRRKYGPASSPINFPTTRARRNTFRLRSSSIPPPPRRGCWLANSYAQQYIPGDESAANTELATQAIGEFKTALKGALTDQQSYQSTVSIASLSLNLKRWDDAREYYMKAIELNPDDAHNYFSMAVIDWTLAYPPRVKMRDDMHLNDSEMISDPAACASLRTQSQHYVEDGIETLEKALQLQPDDDDAMAYMNLLYRERAEYECDQPDARKADSESRRRVGGQSHRRQESQGREDGRAAAYTVYAALITPRSVIPSAERSEESRDLLGAQAEPLRQQGVTPDCVPHHREQCGCGSKIHRSTKSRRPKPGAKGADTEGLISRLSLVFQFSGEVPWNEGTELRF